MQPRYFRSLFAILMILAVAALAFAQDEPAPTAEPAAATEAPPAEEPAVMEAAPVVQPPAPQTIPIFTVDSWVTPTPRYIRLDKNVNCLATPDGGLACSWTPPTE